MKKLVLFLVFLLYLSVAGSCYAFREDPVAVVILDNGYADTQMANDWQERVKRRFRFPDYKILEQRELVQALRGNFPEPESKRPYYRKEQLASIAQTVPAELVFVIWVDTIEEQVFQRLLPFGETVRRVRVSMDITAFRKADGKYLVEKVRYSSTDNIAISTPSERVATDAVADAVNKFREQLPRLEPVEKIADNT